MKPHGKRFRVLAALLLVAAVLLLLAGPHEVLHDAGGGDCSLCLVPAAEAPEPIRLVVPVLLVAHAEAIHEQAHPQTWDWAASAPRAPPVSV